MPWRSCGGCSEKNEPQLTVSYILPRYPFVIAEIDETKPALRKSTLSVIDDYDPARDSATVPFSNFFVFENRQTREFELYLSRYGQYCSTKPTVYQADVCKYTIALE